MLMDTLSRADLFRHLGDDSLSYFVRAWRIPGFRYMFLLRKAAAHKKYSFLGIFYRFWLKRVRITYGFQIAPETKIGAGFYIGHFGTIVINYKAVIGVNCNIAHGVTIGESFGGKSAGVPTIGDRVWMGTGAVIVGGISIGSDVMIAPNAFVNSDIPSEHIAIGNPVRLIKKNNPTKHYVINTIEV